MIATEPLPVKWGLPRDVKFCRRCIMSNQMPSPVIEIENERHHVKPTLAFDEDGICHACRYTEHKKHHIDWTAREAALRDLLDRHRRNDGGYDIIVPSSGGKDSCFIVHLLKHRYGMHPLTVTWAPHIYTPIGWQNFQNLIHAGFDNILVTPNGQVHSRLTRLAFQKLVHPFQPFIIGQKNVAPRISLEKKIPLIMYGENPAEYNSRLEDNFNPRMDPAFFTSCDPTHQKLRLSGYSLDELDDLGIHRSNLGLYFPLDRQAVEENGTEVHYLSYYVPWDPQSNFYYAVENCGFQVNPERTDGTYSKYPSLDDRIDGMHFYTTFIKFGIGRASYDAAQEIRAGHIERDEGVALVRKYDGEFPRTYFKDFLHYTGLSEQEFFDTIDGARSPHLWKQDDDGAWKLRHAVE